MAIIIYYNLRERIQVLNEGPQEMRRKGTRNYIDKQHEERTIIFDFCGNTKDGGSLLEGRGDHLVIENLWREGGCGSTAGRFPRQPLWSRIICAMGRRWSGLSYFLSRAAFFHLYPSLFTFSFSPLLNNTHTEEVQRLIIFNNLNGTCTNIIY